MYLFLSTTIHMHGFTITGKRNLKHKRGKQTNHNILESENWKSYTSLSMSLYVYNMAASGRMPIHVKYEHIYQGKECARDFTPQLYP